MDSKKVKSRGKRFIAGFLALLMAVTLLPVNTLSVAYAEEIDAIEDEVSDSIAVTDEEMQTSDSGAAIDEDIPQINEEELLEDAVTGEDIPRVNEEESLEDAEPENASAPTEEIMTLEEVETDEGLLYDAAGDDVDKVGFTEDGKPTLSISGEGVISLDCPKPGNILTVNYTLDTVYGTDTSTIKWYKNNNGVKSEITDTEAAKPIGFRVCWCGYIMDIYTYGLSDEEKAVWRAHAVEHSANGEPTNYSDHLYDTDEADIVANKTLTITDDFIGCTIIAEVTPDTSSAYPAEGDPEETEPTGVVVEAGFVTLCNLEFIASDIPSGTYDHMVTKTGFTIKADADSDSGEDKAGKAVTVDTSNITIDGLSYTSRLKMGGVGTRDYRSIQFTTGDKAAVLKIICASADDGAPSSLGIGTITNMGGTETLTEFTGKYKLHDGTEKDYEPGGIRIDNNSGIGDTKAETVEAALAANTTYCLYTAEGNGIDFFAIYVTYEGGVRANYYTAKFNANGGTAVASQRALEGEYYLEPSTTRSGYILNGWYLNMATSSEDYKYHFSKKIVSRNLTLYAGWIKDDTGTGDEDGDDEGGDLGFTKAPELSIAQGTSGMENPDLAAPHEGNILTVDYALNLAGAADASMITWYRIKEGAADAAIKTGAADDAGIKSYTVTGDDIGYRIRAEITPKDSAGNTGTAKSAETGMVRGVVSVEKAVVTLPDMDYKYDGRPKTPIPTVSVNDITLTAGKDYIVTYKDNINAGTDAKVIITGQNDYGGSLETSFSIGKAYVEITAKDMTIAIGDPVPDNADYKYDTKGLVGNDKLLREPFLSCEIKDTGRLGTYPIVPSGADAGTNYEITYCSGTLTVAEERVGYKVSFELLGHGTDIAPITGIKAGSLITEPKMPEAERYAFTGWYKDKTFAAKQKWNFDTDTVQTDTTLYACWIEKVIEGNSGLQLSIQDIQDQYYTGSAIKPTVYVYAADGETLLKSGKDYTIKYANNTNIGEAQIIITGKGNYTETIRKSFQILPADISADGGSGDVATGFTLKFSDQLVTNTKKTQNPFSSLKYKKAMKLGPDYMITLSAGSDVRCDAGIISGDGTDPSRWSESTSYNEATKKYSAPAIPKGYYGTFIMTVTGTGNYTGSFTKTVMVTNKENLIKNAVITIGKNQKSRKYENGEAVALTPGWYDTNSKKYYRVDEYGNKSEEDVKDVFTVKVGKTYLMRGTDYEVSYSNNTAVGTATMTIKGMGEYMGSKSVTFKITGTAFNAENIVVELYNDAEPKDTGFRTSTTYTGRAVTQNKVCISTKGTGDVPSKKLDYGTHYTISYKNNIRKGTATMTFKAKPESGYAGSFKKTFKITAQRLSDTMLDGNIVKGNSLKMKDAAAYVKGGVKPSDRIVLTNNEGITLKEGTDYTVKYKNNTALSTDVADAKKPYMTVMGKGNYTGSLTVYFDIVQAELSGKQVIVSQIGLNTKNNYEYKPSVKVVDSASGKALSAGENKDYVITYENNGQENVTAYLNGEANALQPKVVITVPAASSYKLAEGKARIEVPLLIYRTKLTSSNLYVVVSEAPAQITYTGYADRKVTPEVTVYYGEAAAVKAAKENKVSDETVLTNLNGQYKLIRLKELTKISGTEPDTSSDVEAPAPQNADGDYTVTYGANNTAGKNKGKVTITGASKEYGGSVTVKFKILQKNIYSTP